MVELRIEEKPAFFVCGQKVWINGTNNEEFARFWQRANSGGLTDRLKKLNAPSAMERGVLGVSRVEKDPDNRAFYFYIAAETTAAEVSDELELFEIPKATWAVFSAHGENIASALLEAEMYCHLSWLKEADYVHAQAPELEFYPAIDSTLAEYWLPIVEK